VTVMHTPGPWEAGEHGYIYGPKDPRSKFKHGKMIVARILAERPERYQPHEQADALLIAAATELLAACEAALTWLESPSEWNPAPVAAQLRAAICKAKGEPVPTDTREVRFQAALLLLHGDGECGPGCPHCEEAEARAQMEAEQAIPEEVEDVFEDEDEDEDEEIDASPVG
jgi:hypothetical protein